MNTFYDPNVTNNTPDEIIVIDRHSILRRENYFSQFDAEVEANRRAIELSNEWGWVIEWYYADNDEENIIEFQDHQASLNYETWYLPGAGWKNNADDPSLGDLSFN